MKQYQIVVWFSFPLCLIITFFHVLFLATCLGQIGNNFRSNPLPIFYKPYFPLHTNTEQWNSQQTKWSLCMAYNPGAFIASWAFQAYKAGTLRLCCTSGDSAATSSSLLEKSNNCLWEADSHGKLRWCKTSFLFNNNAFWHMTFYFKEMCLKPLLCSGILFYFSYVCSVQGKKHLRLFTKNI